VTTILVRCYECDHTWHQPLRHPVIAANGDTITVVPRAINVECPECGAQVVNYTATTVHVTGESIRGFFALLRSLTSADLEELATIAAKARESGTSTETVAEQIKSSIPSLRPVLAWITSQEGTSVATWIGALLALVTAIITIKGSGSVATTVQRPAIIIECPSGEEQQINYLLQQAADELKSASKTSEVAANANQDQGDRGKHH
jgi:hypothetical protein